MKDLDVAHPMYFAAKNSLKMNFQIVFTTKLRTPKEKILQKKKQRKHFYIQIERSKNAYNHIKINTLTNIRDNLSQH